MKEILALINTKKQEFAQKPFIKFLQDKSIDPYKRLAWAPCAAPFIMGFGELNRNVLRQEPTNDPIQAIINKHTYEDDHHWLWFLEDIKKLGFDEFLPFSDALKFLWSNESKISRWVIHKLFHYALDSDTIQRLIIIEVLESMGNVVFLNAAHVAQEVQAMTGDKYIYFGPSHLAVETGRITGETGVEAIIENIQLTEEQRQAARDLVEKEYQLLVELINEFLIGAKTYGDRQTLVKSSKMTAA